MRVISCDGATRNFETSLGISPTPQIYPVARNYFWIPISLPRTWIVTLVSGAVLISLAVGMRQGFGLFLPSIAADLEIGRGVVAMAIAIQNLAWGLCSPFFGGLADKYGARLPAAVGGLLYAIGLAIMGLSRSGEGIILGQLVIGMGLAGAGFSVVLGAVGRTAPPEKRSLALGIVTAGGSVGQFAMVPVQQSLIGAFGWSQALMILAVGATVMVLFAMGLRNGGGDARLPEDQTLGQALVEARAHRSFILLTTGFFVCGFQVVFIATHLPAFLQDKGVDPAWAAWSLALVGLFNIAGSISAGWLGGGSPSGPPWPGSTCCARPSSPFLSCCPSPAPRPWSSAPSSAFSGSAPCP
jgi:predicted MFS family arabinose efflux permease